MELRSLGRSGLQISPLAFGGNVFGWTADEATSFEVLDRFVELGGTFVFVHVRGGGEKGKRWHDGGRGANKAKTIEDLIDALKALRARLPVERRAPVGTPAAVRVTTR